MDKASASGAGDSRLESWAGHWSHLMLSHRAQELPIGFDAQPWGGRAGGAPPAVRAARRARRAVRAARAARRSHRAPRAGTR